MRVGVIDCGSGNLASVQNAFRYVGADVELIRQPGQLGDASHIVLPGVGSFPDLMQRLTTTGFADALPNEIAAKGKPFLGICVGMQVLATTGHEFESCAGLGLIPGQVRPIDTTRSQQRLPHVGWNDVAPSRSSPLYEGMSQPAFYFVHGFHLVPDDPSSVTGTCDYGEGVTASIEHGNILGVQFHPEKSQHDGLRLMRNFLHVS